GPRHPLSGVLLARARKENVEAGAVIIHSALVCTPEWGSFMHQFEKILLAYDGTEKGRIALRRAVPLLKSGSVGEVSLLAVVPLTGAVAAAEGFYTESMYEAERERVEAVLEDGIALLARQDIQ